MLAETKYILAMDLGTSGPKVALATTRGRIIDHEFESTDVILLPEGGAEQDPEGWWQAIVSATRRLLNKTAVPVEDIIAVCCTTQWSGTVAVDRDGCHLMNAIIWMDSRGRQYVREITGGLISIEGYGIDKLYRWIRLTGGVPGHSGKDPIAHILYIKHHLPEIYKKTFKFLEPKDYINFRLTGRFAASFDSITLHWVTDNRDISNVVYDDKLLKMSGIERDKLPDLKQAVDILGPLQAGAAEELGLKQGIDVVMGTPDLQSAAVGSGAVKDYEGNLYVGTSSWITCHVPFKKTNLFYNMVSLPSAIPDRYLVANEQESAGACLNYLKNNILYHKDALLIEEGRADIYKVFDKIAENAPPGSGKVIFTPWLYGERTPVEDHSLRAMFFNQSLATTREHLIRSVFEGVAYNARWLLEYVEKFIKQPFASLNIIGGGANSNIWCRIFADVLDRPVKQVKNPIQANVRGAAFLAAVSIGCMQFSDIPDLIEIENTYTPNPENRKIYDTLYREFRNLYKCNRKIYKRLN